MARDRGTVMASGWVDSWDDVLSTVKKQDLYTSEEGTYGLSTEPHVTILHGLDEKVHEDLVCRICQAVSGPLELEVKGLSKFEKEDYDVLKYDVGSDLLQKMNTAFESLPYENDYDDYKPHLTVGYFRKGAADKYVDELEQALPKKVGFERFEFQPAKEEESLKFPI